MKSIKWQDYIERDPQILFGKPSIKGTRIPVDLIVEKLACGETISGLLEDYPRLSEAAIYACLHFAAENIRSIPLSKAA
jgi:uncharacterized protein (DUF433 family)